MTILLGSDPLFLVLWSSRYGIAAGLSPTETASDTRMQCLKFAECEAEPLADCLRLDFPDHVWKPSRPHKPEDFSHFASRAL